MFDSLSERLGTIFDGLKRRGALTEADVTAAMREVRVALLEADVALDVVKDFTARVRDKAVGQTVLKSVTPGQQVIKIVHDELVATLGSDDQELSLAVAPPAVMLMVGLQGSGKTTSTAKIAKRLSEKDKKKVLMASLDVRRPAAQEQLRILGEQIGVKTLPVIEGQMPVDITKRALKAAELQGFDVLILDTAGRLHVDESLMAEVVSVRDISRPAETLLVADSLTGQDAVNVAKAFDARVGITGVVLTRMDGDGRGGAALSMRAVTGKPVKLVGMGEKMDALETFHGERVAGRILGMGDVVSLVEKASETIEREDAEKMAKKMAKGMFDLEDMLSQLRQMKKMGGLKGIMGLLPGMGGIKKAMGSANMDDSVFKRQEAIILSMTRGERTKPQVISASRKKRIAAGAGVQVSEVNKLLKTHMQMAKMMKKMSAMGKKGKMPDLSALSGMMGPQGGAGMPGSGLSGGGLPGALPPGFDKFLK